MSQLFYDFAIIATVAIIAALTSIKIKSYIESNNSIAKTLVNVVMALIAMPYIFWFTGEGLGRQGLIYLIVHSMFSVAFLCTIGLAILKRKE